MKKISLILVFIILLLTSGCGCRENVDKSVEPEKTLEEGSEVDEEEDKYTLALKEAGISKAIKRKPGIAKLPTVSLKDGKLPEYDPGNIEDSFQVDLANKNLTNLDISEIKNGMNSLMHANFDTYTKWPDETEKYFDHDKILEYGKNPGLGIRSLHKQGITGKGIGIAIIDGSIPVEHEEIKDSIRYYDEIGEVEQEASMHGAAVSSIAVGKNVGVAPEADLYYISSSPTVSNGNISNYDFRNYAKAIERILKIDECLPKENKIRVISISVGWTKEDKGYDEITAAVKKANDAGIFVVCSSIGDIYGYRFDGLGRNPLEDPDNPGSYTYGSWYIDRFFEDYDESIKKVEKSLLIPMDARTTASHMDNKGYSYFYTGGWSWCIPYIAGVYTLACQVNPDITYEEFWNKALNTADTINFTYNEMEGVMPNVLNPAKLMEAVKK